jgi:hypothetical protein
LSSSRSKIQQRRAPSIFPLATQPGSEVRGSPQNPPRFLQVHSFVRKVGCENQGLSYTPAITRFELLLVGWIDPTVRQQYDERFFLEGGAHLPPPLTQARKVRGRQRGNLPIMMSAGGIRPLRRSRSTVCTETARTSAQVSMVAKGSMVETSRGDGIG